MSAGVVLALFSLRDAVKKRYVVIYTLICSLTGALTVMCIKGVSTALVLTLQVSSVLDMRVCVCVCVRARAYIFTHTHTHVHVCMCARAYIHTHTHAHMPVQTYTTSVLNGALVDCMRMCVDVGVRFIFVCGIWPLTRRARVCSSVASMCACVALCRGTTSSTIFCHGCW